MSTPEMRELVRLAKLGRRAEDRGKAAQGCLTLLIRVAVIVAMRAWSLMVGVGIVHLHWLPGMPAMGFWVAVAVTTLVAGAFRTIPPTAKKNGTS